MKKEVFPFLCSILAVLFITCAGAANGASLPFGNMEWEASYGKPVVSEGKMDCPIVGQTTIVKSKEMFSDFTMTVDIAAYESEFRTKEGTMCCRYIHFRDGYKLQIFDNLIDLWRKTDGQEKYQGEYRRKYKNGQPESFKIVAAGEKVEISLNGEVIIKTSDPAIVPGSITLRTYLTHVVFENFVLEKDISSLTRAAVLALDEIEKQNKCCMVRLDEVEKTVAAGSVDSTDEKSWRELLTNKIRMLNDEKESVEHKIAELRSNPDLSQVDALKRKLLNTGQYISQMEKVVDALKKGNLKSPGIVIYAVEPVSDRRILPDTPVIPGEITHEIRMTACPGEYEPAGFVVQSLSSDIVSMEAVTSGLKGEKTSLPQSAVDIRVVKCWYKGPGRELVPDLLLKDDSLVRNDPVKKETYLRLDYPAGSKYVCINLEEGISGIPSMPTVDEFPVRDSAVLRTMDIPRNENKEFVVTIQIPDEAGPGLYVGNIELKSKGVVIGTIALKVKVLPFRLSPPYCTASVYYESVLDEAGKGTISTYLKNEKQLRAELGNLRAHGVNPTLYKYGDFEKEFSEARLEKMLEMRKDAGIKNEDIYCLLKFGIPSGQPAIESLKESVKKFVGLCKRYGATRVYLYGSDEARGEALKSQRLVWEAIHENGAKIFVSGYRGSNFEQMGDIQDLLVCAGQPAKEEAAKWHSRGHRIFSYANPQAGASKPDTYRRNFGLLLWQNDYDGAMDFAYMFNEQYVNLHVNKPYNHIWNNYDCQNVSQNNFVYPTADGVVDTLDWEGYREGIDDVRYVTTLLDMLERGKNIPNLKTGEAVRSAEQYLKDLKDTDLTGKDLSIVRLEVISHILELQKELNAKN